MFYMIYYFIEYIQFSELFFICVFMFYFKFYIFIVWVLLLATPYTLKKPRSGLACHGRRNDVTTCRQHPWRAMLCVTGCSWVVYHLIQLPNGYWEREWSLHNSIWVWDGRGSSGREYGMGSISLMTFVCMYPRARIIAAMPGHQQLDAAYHSSLHFDVYHIP